MDILVTGGTGFIGRRLCHELDSRGHDVTALARTPDGSLSDGIETVRGDVTDYDSISMAFDGRDVVVNLVALSPLFRPKGGERMHDRVHRDGTENVIRAAETHDLDRIVQLSGVHAAPDGPTAYLRAKGNAEDLVSDSAVKSVIVRPSVVFGDGGEFVSFVRKVAPPYITPLPGGGITRFQPIWVGDLAPMLADTVEGDDHVGRTYELGGPEVLTLAEVVDLAHAAGGRPTTVVPVPMALVGLGMTMGSAIPGFPFGPDQYRSLQLDLVVEDNDIDAFDVESDDLTTLAEYLGVDVE